MVNQGGMKVLSSDGKTIVGKVCRSNRKKPRPSLRLFIPQSIAEECGIDGDTFVTFHPNKNDSSFVVRKAEDQTPR